MQAFEQSHSVLLPISLKKSRAKSTNLIFNALRVVALDYLLELDRNGFIDDLWAQK